jgi:hypothetical protein
MSSGYSKRSLSEKLGIKPKARVLLVGAPAGFEKTLEPLPEGAHIARTARGLVDLAHCFVTRRADLAREFPRLSRRIESDGALWISWPKKASGVTTDLDESVVRSIGLANALVDVKVCAVDDTWSGLKFVYRLADRPEKSRRDGDRPRRA